MYEKIAADTMMEKDGATDLGLPSAVQPEQQLLVGILFTNEAGMHAKDLARKERSNQQCV